MRRLEKVLWSTGCCLGTVLCFYTLTLPDERANKLWGGHDAAWCVPVAVILLLGCLLWIFLQTRREGR